MDKQSKGDSALSSIIRIFGDIAKRLIPGLPWYVRAFIFLLIILALFIIAVLIAGAIGSKNGLIICVLFIILAFVVFLILIKMGIKWERTNTRLYPTEEMVKENTIVFANQLTDQRKKRILKVLKKVALTVAEALNVRSEFVRSNIFGKDEGDNLKMITDLTFQMDRTEELSISMPIGYGSTGRCFNSSEPNIAILENDWGKDVIEDEELRKVHPDLKWIISVPVLGGEPLRPAWVLNVDGLYERRTREDLLNALRKMFKFSKTVSLILAQKDSTKGGNSEIEKS